jgi:hypothetical protein
MPRLTTEQLQTRVIRIALVHFFMALALGLSIIVYQSWQLIPLEDVWKRWEVLGILAVVTTAVWYSARRITNLSVQKLLVGTFIALDVSLASFWVYAERGMAARGVVLFAVPLAVAASLRSRSALFATACISTAAYLLACVKYFVDYFNEGYSVELYSTIALYGAVFFVLAGLLWIAVGSDTTTKTRRF